jgi:deoxyribodipyrimidine photo-lyase
VKTLVNIFWFRRDLRLIDNAGLHQALQAGLPVLPIFIFDRNILDKLENRKDARVEFIHHSLAAIQRKLKALPSSLEIFYGKPAEVFTALQEKYQIGQVFINEDYEPYALERDAEVEKLLKTRGIGFHSFRDQVVFSKQDVVKDDGTAYSIFTPYSNKWKALLLSDEKKYLKHFASERLLNQFFKQENQPLPELNALGFSPSGKKFPSAEPDREIFKNYQARRDFPGLDASSHLGIHLRFGTVSIRQLAKEALRLSPVFLNELIWRDFYHMILWHFPRVGRGYAFKVAFEKIRWRNNEKEFTRWCRGLTGYPLVDAGMRQLNETGFMHNRVRMVTASFLAKHLLIDWRWGEAYFAGQLLDYDLASNNGGWQWAAGCGCDAAPYFRIFNPSIQQNKFDPEGSYVKKWLPGFQELNYPPPIVEHQFARSRAISVYREALMVDR